MASDNSQVVNPISSLKGRLHEIEKSGEDPYSLLGIDKSELKAWERAPKNYEAHIERANELLRLFYDDLYSEDMMNEVEKRVLHAEQEMGAIADFNRAYIEGKVDMDTLASLHESPLAYTYFKLKGEFKPDVDYDKMQEEIPEVRELYKTYTALEKVGLPAEKPEDVLSKASSMDDVSTKAREYREKLLETVTQTDDDIKRLSEYYEKIEAKGFGKRRTEDIFRENTYGLGLDELALKKALGELTQDELEEYKKNLEATVDYLYPEPLKKSKWKALMLAGLVGAGLASGIYFNHLNIKNIEDKNKQQDSKLSELNSQVSGLDQKVDLLQSNVSALASQLQLTNQEYTNILNNFTSFQLEVMQHLNLLDNASAENYSTIMRILQGDYQFARNVEDNISALQSQLDSLLQSMSENDTALRNEIQALTQQLNNLDNLSAEERQNLSERIQALNTALNNTDLNVDQLRQNLFVVYAQLNSTRENLTDAQELLDRLTHIPVFNGTNYFEVGMFNQSYSWRIDNADSAKLYLSVGDVTHEFNLTRNGNNFTFNGSIFDLVLANYLLTGQYQNVPVKAMLVASNTNGSTPQVQAGKAILPSVDQRTLENELAYRAMYANQSLESLLNEVKSETNITYFMPTIDNATSNELLNLTTNDTLSTLENILNYTKEYTNNGTVEEVERFFKFFTKYVFDVNSNYSDSIEMLTGYKTVDPIFGPVLEDKAGVVFIIDDGNGEKAVNLVSGLVGNVTHNPDGSITISGDWEEIHTGYFSLPDEEKKQIKFIPLIGRELALWNGEFR